MPNAWPLQVAKVQNEKPLSIRGRFECNQAGLPNGKKNSHTYFRGYSLSRSRHKMYSPFINQKRVLLTEPDKYDLVFEAKKFKLTRCTRHVILISCKAT